MHVLPIALLAAASLCATTRLAAADAAPRLLDTIGVYETEVAAYMAPNAKPAWVPAVKLVVQFAGYAQEDVVLVQWKGGGKAIGKPAPCTAIAFAKDTQINPQTPVHAVNLARFECRHPNAEAIARAGNFTLDLVYKETLADKKTPLGTLAMTVVELKQGSQNKQTTTWTVSHDHRLGLATVEEHQNRLGDYGVDFSQAILLHDQAAKLEKLGGPTHYAIRFWTKFKQGGPKTLAMACLLDGKRVVEARHTGGETRSYWTYKGKEKESGEWEQQVFQFYGSRVWKAGEEGANVWQWSDHPGDYRCVATAGGETVKEVFFTIGADGAIVDNACQAQIATLRHIHVARAKDGAISNTNFDARAAKQAFFGRVTWKAGCPDQ